MAQPTTGIRRGRRAGSAAAEPVFDAIVRQASALCGAPIAVLSLRQGKQHRILALAGRTDTDALPLWLDVCSRNLATDDWVEVEDTLADPRCNGLRALPAAPLVRAFAAKPLRLDSGEAVGMLWLLSDQPHRLAPAQARVLAGLASIAGHALALRGDALANHATASASTATAPAPTTPETETETETGTDTDTDTEIRYRAIVEDQVDMISLARADGRLVYVNPAYARHFGHRPPEMIGISLFDFIAAPDRDPVRRLLTQVLDSGVSVHSENRMQAADGTTLWVAWTNGLQVDARQQRLLHSVGRDVTQRKLAELALRASQAFLERTGRVAGVGGWELAIASGALTWSNETRRIHDVSADYPPTLTEAIAFYAPQARAAIAAAVQRSLDSGDPWDLELPFVTATGRAIWVRTVGEAEFEQGKAVRLVGAIQDVTERHQLELQLADNARFLRQLTDGLPLRIAYLDDQRRYRFVNQELLRHLGRARDEVIGRTRIDLRPDDDDAILGQRAQAALQGQDQRFEFEEVVDGQPRRFENRLVPDRDPTGRVRGFFVTGIDITERSAAERAMRELTTIFDNTTDLVVQTDRRGQINYMNPSARRAVGLAADAPLAGRNFTEFNTDATNRLFAQTIVPAVKQGAVWVGETSLNLAGRLAVPASHMVIGHLDGQGRVDRYSSVIRDISAEVQAKQQVLRQTATLRSVAEAIPATVVVIDTDGSCRFVNRAYERWCGLPRERIIGHQASEVLGAAEFARRKDWIARAAAGEAVNFTLAYPSAEGVRHLAMSYVPLRLDSGEPDGFVAVTQDITAQQHEQERLRQLAQRDPLTGLLNRAGFQAGLESFQSPTGPGGLAVMYIDLDNFKPVNDCHGHPAGDQVLALFAQRLAALVRPSDLVARLGGDEFAIALADVREATHAAAVADKVLVAARDSYPVGPLRLSLGASVGVAFTSAANPCWRELLALADARLLLAKAAGKGCQSGATL